MTTALTAHLADLAETLRDLRQRLRQTARAEVARAIADALREFALTTICGPTRYRSPERRAYAPWDDPWGGPADDPTEVHGAYDTDVEEDGDDRQHAVVPSRALVAGLGAARWTFGRTRQIGPAILVGVLAAVAAHCGGPTVRALVEAWSMANELLSQPARNRGP